MKYRKEYRSIQSQSNSSSKFPYANSSHPLHAHLPLPTTVINPSSAKKVNTSNFYSVSKLMHHQTLFLPKGRSILFPFKLHCQISRCTQSLDTISINATNQNQVTALRPFFIKNGHISPRRINRNIPGSRRTSPFHSLY